MRSMVFVPKARGLIGRSLALSPAEERALLPISRTKIRATGKQLWGDVRC